MSAYDFSAIPSILDSQQLIDATLYKLTRKSPTVIRKGFQISRIRSFYTLKVKLFQNYCDQYISKILQTFPQLNSIHPFYNYWLSTMYSKDHYKVALAHLSTAKLLIDKVGKHYIKLLKHADSLYQCKTLKVAAIGRMVSILRKQNVYLVYLETIRQHMQRLPAIDPAARSVILIGCPNSGKSSFLNSITSAKVDVQSYAFTTQQLLIGHYEYEQIKFQIIDSPGLLDGNLEGRNIIELQAISALAYLNSSVLFFVDPTQDIQKQLSLYQQLTILMKQKPVCLVMTKADIWQPSDLQQQEIDMIEQITGKGSFQFAVETVQKQYLTNQQYDEAINQGGQTQLQALQLRKQEKEFIIQLTHSNSIPLVIISSNGYMNTERCANVTCEQLLQYREQQRKQSSNGNENTINGLFVAQPKILRPSKGEIPQSVQLLNQQGLHPRPLGEQDNYETYYQKQEAAGGCTKFALDERMFWTGIPEEERHDQIPYIHNGKNIMNFIMKDNQLEKLIQELEEEEKQLTEEDALKQQQDQELFARLAAFENAVGVKHKDKYNSTDTQKKFDKLRENQILKQIPQKLIQTEVTPRTNLPHNKFDKLMQETNYQVPLEQIKREFDKRRKAGSKPFQYLEPHVDKEPKFFFSGKMNMKTHDWR